MEERPQEEAFVDEILVSGNSSEEDTLFDRTIGKLEDILLDEEFLDFQSRFFEQHCQIFEDTEENKLEYTPIFEEYVRTMERYIEDRIHQEMPDFSLEAFAAQLQQRSAEFPEDIFEMIHNLTEFNSFKEMMLANKQAADAPLFASLHISSFAL
eukprot:gnl/Trimastix_PCT/3227.p1 GENE.gnl/Trimastix_PCT/3227~~gnl/Trimastix_PCT/3227.p1  ORF type:complete len:154 (-),score=46.72 gnl/Trimastix_PCT/3227:87-548(-)